MYDPITKRKVSLEDVLLEIDLEEQIEKAIADGVPLPPVVKPVPRALTNAVPVPSATEGMPSWIIQNRFFCWTRCSVFEEILIFNS